MDLEVFLLHCSTNGLEFIVLYLLYVSSLPILLENFERKFCELELKMFFFH